MNTMASSACHYCHLEGNPSLRYRMTFLRKCRVAPPCWWYVALVLQRNVVQGARHFMQISVLYVTSETLQEGLWPKAAVRMRYISNFCSTEIIQNIQSFSFRINWGMTSWSYCRKPQARWKGKLIKHCAMKTWGSGAPPFLTSALDGREWSASRPSRFIPGDSAPGAHCIGGRVGPRAGPNTVEKRKIFYWIVPTPKS
jgi:hypothetical protein